MRESYLSTLRSLRSNNWISLDDTTLRDHEYLTFISIVGLSARYNGGKDINAIRNAWITYNSNL